MRSILLIPLLAALAAPGFATELLDARLTAAAAPVLQNAGATVRLEQPQFNGMGHRTFFVPEPGALWQLGSGIAGLALLQARRRRRVAVQFRSAVGR